MNLNFARIPWERKASSWEARAISDPALLAEIQAQVNDGRLPIYRSSELYPCSRFTGTDRENRPQFFVALRHTGTFFLVNTEGADYARYITQLPGFELAPGVEPQ